MDVVITPNRLSGKVEAVSSKSDAHRKIIAAALSDKSTKIKINRLSEDIEATLSAIEALGGKYKKDNDAVIVSPIQKTGDKAELDFRESGSTARFLMPVAATLYEKCTFTGHGRLPMRPFGELVDEMTKNGVIASSKGLPMQTTGRMKNGVYTLPGNVSSQYISGLLFALPLIEGESEIRLTTKLDSAAYVNMTLDTLADFGVEISKCENIYKISGQRYKSRGEYSAEGDWSNGAFWITADKICGGIEITGLSDKTYQGDKKIVDILDERHIDASQIPDLVPILSVLAAARNGRTQIYGAERLRIKESDRLGAMSKCINALGGNVKETADGLIIEGGGGLRGGIVDGCNDHRVVMSAAIASCICKESVTIKGAEAVNKSYPTFFEDFKKLGGIYKCIVSATK